MSEQIEGGKPELNQTTEHRSERSPSPERRHPSPRIYVASLADYNAGELLGVWIDAAQEPEDLHAEIQAMLARSEEEVAEEWAIHDYEGFGPFRVHEYETMDVVSAVAKGIAEHGTAFAAYVSWAGTEEEALRQLPEDLQLYVTIDYDGLARLAETVMNIVEYDGEIYVFGER